MTWSKRWRTWLLLFALCAPAETQIFSPTVLRKGQIDATSLSALAKSIYAAAGATTERQKAEAIWRFFNTDGRFVKPGFWYHIAGWAYEEPAGEVLDPVKLLNSYGFGLCYHIAPLLEAVFEAGGFPDARVWFLTGHTVTEVFYEGAYHYYDSDMMGYTPAGKGDFRTLPIASVPEIEKDGGILLGKLKSPTEVDASLVDYPWYPGDLREKAIGGLAELFTTSADNWLFPDARYSQGHTMDFALRPGEKLVRYFEPEPEGTFYLPYKFDGSHWKEFPQEIAAYKIRTDDGPKSQKDARYWGTGLFEYRPPPGREILEISSPYVIIDADFTLNAEIKDAGGSITFETSTDSGKTWDGAGVLKGPHQGPWKTAPLVEARSAHGMRTAVSGAYGYLVRISATGSATARDLTINTLVQLNPRTLPALEPGRNEMTYHPGTPQPRWEIPIRLDRIDKFAAKALNSRYISEEGQGFLTAANVKPAEYIIELSAPDGSTITGFDTGGRFLDIRDGLAPDKLTAEVRKTSYRASHSSPKASLAWSTSLDGEHQMLWEYDEKQAWRDGKPIDRLLRWPEVDRPVRSLPPGTKRVYVRYRIDGIALDDIRVAVIGEERKTQGRLEITHTWLESGQERSHTERITDPSSEHRYLIETGPGAVVNRAVTFSAF